MTDMKSASQGSELDQPLSLQSKQKEAFSAEAGSPSVTVCFRSL